MKQLILVRHAKSSWDNPALKDFDRPLNNRGLKNAPMMGVRLQSAGCVPEVVVSSPAKRAWDTAKLICREIGFPVEDIQEGVEIYGASMETLLALISGFDSDWQNVMLVGHNPGFTELAGTLSGEVIDNIPTCGICQIEFDIESWQEIYEVAGELFEFDYPKRN